MYIPKMFQNNDHDQIMEFIAHNGFANLVSNVDGKLWATHIPLMLSKDKTILYGHVSKANEQWKHFKQSEDVLAIFNGPHAYISSSWYDHENVPTWNYIAVHVYGSIRIIEGDELIQSLSDLTDKYEKHSANPVSVEKMSKDYFDSHVRALVGVAIQIKNIEAAYKLSQNRDKKNHDTIIKELRSRNSGDDLAIAREMEKTKK